LETAKPFLDTDILLKLNCDFYEPLVAVSGKETNTVIDSLHSMTRFSPLDYAVVAAYLIGVVILGLIFSKRQTSLKEYYHASSSLPWWAVGISMIATQLSPISYLAIPGTEHGWRTGGRIRGHVRGCEWLTPAL